MIYNSLKEFVDKYKKCVVCGKQLQLYFSGHVNPSHFKAFGKKQTGVAYDSTQRILMTIENDLCFPKPNGKGIGKYDFSININNNKIDSGNHLVTSLFETYDRRILMCKKCSTCRFAISASSTRTDISAKNYIIGPKINEIPQIKDCYQSLSVRVKGSRDLYIRKSANYFNSISVIRIDYNTGSNNKPIRLNNQNDDLIDFSKHDNIKKILQIVKTIKTFY